ncbi:MAG: 50S ribosomal protein L3 [Deltaproteobacteria bacterium]|nr:50S ribosomal protein L3 [Deltaproteobacteria bacterium]
MAARMGLLGKKLGMTQVFLPDGERIPVTVIATGPCVVVAKRTLENDKYAAIQIGFEEKKPARTNRPETGHFSKAGVKPMQVVREIRLADGEVGKYEVGQVIKATDVFKPGTCVDVIGQSKGKGYQGVMKRHHMGGSRNTHGAHEFFRHGGSIGCRLTPGRVHKGKRMSGHMGDERKTVQNLEVVDVLSDENVVLVRGAIPGAKNGYVLVQAAVKKTMYKKKRTEPVEEKSKNPMKASKAGATAKPKK